MNERYEVIKVKDAYHYLTLRDFNRHAFFCNTPEATQRFGDAVYFVDEAWMKKAQREIWGS